MSKTINVSTDGFLLIEDFSEWLDVAVVEFYSMHINDDSSITVKFYDKSKKLIKPHDPK